MAFSRPYFCVLLVKPDDPNGVSTLCHQVLLGIYANTLIFVTPTVLQALFETELGKLDALILAAIHNQSQVGPRDAQSRKMYGLLKKLLKYADPICDGNLETMGKTGFPSNHQPSKLSPPPAPSVSKVVKGKKANTYQALLKRKNKKTNVESDPATHLKGVLYIVEISTNPQDTTTWKVVCESSPSTKLIINSADTVPGKLNYIRIHGVNSAGVGNASVPFPFTPDAQL